MEICTNNTSNYINWGVVSQPIHGESVTGDSYIIKVVKNNVLVAVIDGLGHGIEAADASQKAVECIDESQETSPIRIFQNCHEKLKRTRGVVMSLAVLDFANHSMEWLGVGNIEAIIIHNSNGNTVISDRLLTKGGVVGYVLPYLKSSYKTIHQGDVLILATDGIKDITSNDLLNKDLILEHSPQKMAEKIFSTHKKPSDDGLIWVGRIQRS